MPSKNEPADQPESQPSDLFSSVETRAMLEEFRELVRAGILRVTPENEVLPGRQRQGEPGLERPAETTASREEEVALLDRQLLDWFEKRREVKGHETRPGAPKPAASSIEALGASVRQKVIERVAHKVLESWDEADRSADPHDQLREQIVDRIVEDVLRRMQRNLE